MGHRVWKERKQRRWFGVREMLLLILWGAASFWLKFKTLGECFHGVKKDLLEILR